MSDVSMQFPGERLPFLSDEKNLRDEKNLHDTAISRASYFLNFLALKIQNGFGEGQIYYVFGLI